MESEKTDVYASHIGDGDTKSDSKVVKKNLYQRAVAQKL